MFRTAPGTLSKPGESGQTGDRHGTDKLANNRRRHIDMPQALGVALRVGRTSKLPPASRPVAALLGSITGVAAVVELRRRFPGLSENAGREATRMIIRWRPPQDDGAKLDR
jgi:hypothetical protein